MLNVSLSFIFMLSRTSSDIIRGLIAG